MLRYVDVVPGNGFSVKVFFFNFTDRVWYKEISNNEHQIYCETEGNFQFVT